MCRKNKTQCVLLDPDPARWDKFAPLTPDQSLIDGFAPFEMAVRAAAKGHPEAATSELANVDGDAVRTWFIEHAQVAGNRRYKTFGKPPIGTWRGEVDPIAYPRAAVVMEVFAADAYRCRYCQRQVVHVDLLKHLRTILGREVFSLGPTNLEMHGSAVAHRGVVDHLLPRKRGGRTEPGNLVTSCYPCNYGKAHYTLDDIALAVPRPVKNNGWDGLVSLMPALADVARRVAKA